MQRLALLSQHGTNRHVLYGTFAQRPRQRRRFLFPLDMQIERLGVEQALQHLRHPRLPGAGRTDGDGRPLAFQRLAANQDQINIWTNGGTELIYLFPRHCLPVDPTEAHLGSEIAKWYNSNGAQGTAPTDPEMKRALDLFRSAAGQQEDERNKTAQEIWKIIVEQQFSIGTVGQSPAQFGVRIVSRKLANIPGRACVAQHCRTPGTSHPETWYFKA